MKAVFAILVGVMALGVTTLGAAADEKTCKPGQVYDEAQGKCVTPRGS
ncbi:carbohydrate-binding module family 14 protein [Hyphomicrobium sp. NDB2Meth4]|nr:carbohydrate-binding module family 14 protein [Hyphomicrobium sp. NDB2Meth4]